MKRATPEYPCPNTPARRGEVRKRHRTALYLALGASTGFGTPAVAQTSQHVELEEIVVTATRRTESLQNVPVSITALTGEQLEKLKFFKFDDIAMATPGLAMSNTSRDGAVISVRGVGFNTYSSAPPAVDVYFNELPLNAIFAFNSIFDLQQMELLRGPQGTLRGRPAPAGAITVTTRRPDLDETSGHVSGSLSDADGQNIEAAINVPVISDKLALRIVGIKNQNEGPGGKTLDGDEQQFDDEAVRFSALFQPTEQLSFLLTHQYMESDVERFDLVAGLGAGYNGPALDAGDRRGVLERVATLKQENSLTSLLVNWDLDGNRVVYVGGYQDLQNHTYTDTDVGNAVSAFTNDQNVATDFNVWTHELRLESTGERRWDYTAGLWYSDTQTRTHVRQFQQLDGAFGEPASVVGPIHDEYVLGINVDIPTDAENKAVFGHVEFHATDKLDVGLGARYLEEESDRSQTLKIGSGLNAAGITPGTPFSQSFPWAEAAPWNGFCPGFLSTVAPSTDWVRENYPGYCDLRVTVPTFTQPVDDEWNEWVYDASIKYQLSEDVMTYLTAAHSWRPPGATVGVTAPVPDDILFGPPEESDSFELGLKSEWIDRRLRLNAALFYQEFDGFIGRFEDIPYLNTTNNQVTVGGFTYNGDATVYGMEADLLFLITDDWNAQLMVSTSQGEYDDADVPCRDTNFDGTPDSGANPTAASWGAPGPVAFCKSDDSISSLPDWSATLQSEYVLPRDSLEYYLRGLLNYQPENDNFISGFERDSFAIVNLYAGLRSADGKWDATLWAKNLFDDDTVMDAYTELTLSTFNTGYHTVIMQPEREVGFSLRYNFGGG